MTKIKVTHKTLMVNFKFPLEVVQVKMDAVCQVFLSQNKESKQLMGYFEFIDHDNITYMGMPIDGYKAWNKLCDHHTEFGIDLRKLINNEFDNIVTEEFQQEFLKQFDVKQFEL